MSQRPLHSGQTWVVGHPISYILEHGTSRQGGAEMNCSGWQLQDGGRRAKSRPPGNVGLSFCPFCSPNLSVALPPGAAGVSCPGTMLASHPSSSVPRGPSLNTVQLQSQTFSPGPNPPICIYANLCTLLLCVPTYTHVCTYMCIPHTHTLCISQSYLH